MITAGNGGRRRRPQADGRRGTGAASLTNRIERDGYAIVDGVLSAADVARLVAALCAVRPADGGPAAWEKNDRLYAVRNLLGLVPAVRAAADSPAVRALVGPVLGPSARPVRGLLFDKTPGANWKVAWHQDLSIAVRRRVDLPGFGPWSVKAGVPHVQPPAGVLRDMLTVRLHLDDCGPDNGPLRVLPGSHDGEGALSPRRLEERCRDGRPVACHVRAGGAVLMRPLLLHASSPAASPRHRRVVHIEYAAGDLPGGLEWYESADAPRVGLQSAAMSLPMIGTLRVDVKAARPFTIHGDLYYEIHATRADDPAGSPMALRIPEHAIPAPPQPGQALEVTFLMGQVTAAKPV